MSGREVDVGGEGPIFKTGCDDREELIPEVGFLLGLTGPQSITGYIPMFRH